MAEKNDVLIIGGGISGITLALELARLDFSPVLIEKEPNLGGLAASFCCKASDSCNKCFACVVDKRISEVCEHPGVSIMTRTEITGVTGGPGRYSLSLRRGKERLEREASAVVLAVGIDPYDAAQKEEYGYGRYKNVITARDLDEMLRFRGALSRPSDGQIPKRIAFFQCVGSRDESIGNLYCSQVCCAYALRLIRAIRHQHPEVEASFFYMDIQPAGSFFRVFLESCRQDKGIRFIRNLPSKIYHTPRTQALRIRLTDSEKEAVLEESFDLIVLSVGMVPRPSSERLRNLFHLSLTEDGFMDAPPLQTGVFVTGACRGPKDIDRSILQAKSTATQVLQYLKERN